VRFFFFCDENSNLTWSLLILIHPDVSVLSHIMCFRESHSADRYSFGLFDKCTVISGQMSLKSSATHGIIVHTFYAHNALRKTYSMLLNVRESVLDVSLSKFSDFAATVERHHTVTCQPIVGLRNPFPSTSR
jgi:hypothetical protein